MQLNIIFSGPDMCGKTNISRELSRVLGIPYFKASDEVETFTKNPGKFVNDIRYADPRLVDFLRQTGYSAVFDRGYPCEWVYSRFYERETDLAALTLVDSIYAEMGTVIIVPWRSSYHNVVDDLDDTLKGDRLKQIEGLYCEFAGWTRCKTMFLNVDSQDLGEQIAKIVDFLAGVKGQ